MNQSNYSTIALLVILLIITNRKPIATYNGWLFFRVKMLFKQHLNSKMKESVITPLITKKRNKI